MRVVKTIAGMKELRPQLAPPVGFVPTMGYLHEGHLSLVTYAKDENVNVVVSIFVNPTQFGPKEDFACYPRDLDRDLAMLERVGTDVVFAPTTEDMYPPGFDTWVEVGELSKPLEGASRSTHFRGVTTVVAKLFNIVQPNKAYFGQKDAQQALVLTKMAADLNMNLEVVTCPTKREPDGLAMSSRNIYLNEEERKAAKVLYKALLRAKQQYQAGEKGAARLRQGMIDLIKSEPLANIDYVSIASNETLKEIEAMITPPALVSLAVKFGNTRLIDNVVLE
ncbi:MAG: pantoate--beta-alanine ligase [Chloroflexota bacterium]